MLPQRRREYRSYVFDSRNWSRFVPRDGDVVISTSYKSGTTWMQNIVVHLLFRGRGRPGGVGGVALARQHPHRAGRRAGSA